MRLITLVTALFLLSAGVLQAQDVAKLPSDPRILSGKMANGLTYYLVKNDISKGYADFYLVTKSGLVTESRNQKGMSSMIGNLGMRGTRNFPGHTILSYIDKLGMVPDRDLTITTRLDDCIYRLSNVPVGKSANVLDSTLLILFNWSNSINIDEEDVNDEKYYCKNLYLADYTLQNRLDNSFRKELLKDTRYVPVEMDTLFANIDSYTSKDLRNYYYQWSRTDLQAVVIVGDIDAASVETKIKTLFQASPTNLSPLKRNYEDIADNKELAMAVVSDKEATSSILQLAYKSNTLPERFKATAIPYITDMMNDMSIYLLGERMDAMRNSVETPISSIDIDYGKYLGTRNEEALTIKVETFPEYIDTVLTLVTRELERVKRDGFSEEEFHRARTRYYSALEYVYDWRMNTTNDAFALRCLGNFLEGYTLASIEMNKEYMDGAKAHTSADQLNTYIQSYLRHDENCVLTCSYPRNAPDSLLTVDRLKKIYDNAVNKKLPQFVQKPVIDSLVSIKPTAGSIVSQTAEPITNSQMWILSNGATVIAKKVLSEPRRVHFNAVAKGGLSLFEGNNPAVIKYINEIAALETLSGVSHVETGRVMRLYNMSLQKKISLSLNQLVGYATTDDLKMLMEMTYSHFAQNGSDLNAYRKFVKKELCAVQYDGNNPEKLFSDTMTELMYKKSNISSVSETDAIKGIDYAAVTDFIKRSYSNAANFTFIFVGDFDMEELKEYVTKYIASLPGNSNTRESWRVVPMYLDKTDKSLHIDMDMEVAKTYYKMTLMRAVPYNVEDVVGADIAAQIIQRRIKSEMLKKGVKVSSNIDFIKYPEEFMTLGFSFIAKDYNETLIEEVKSILRELAEKGVDEREINTVKFIHKSQFNLRQRNQNTFWTEMIVNRFIYGKDFYSRQLSFVDSVSPATINEIIKSFVEGSSRTVLTMSGK